MENEVLALLPSASGYFSELKQRAGKLCFSISEFD